MATERSSAKEQIKIDQYRSVHRRYRRNIDEQVLDIESGSHEGAPQAVGNVRTVGEHGLFDDLVKELFDETGLGVVTAGGEFGHVARPRQMDGRALIGGVVTGRIDRPVARANVETANRI